MRWSVWSQKFRHLLDMRILSKLIRHPHDRIPSRSRCLSTASTSISFMDPGYPSFLHDLLQMCARQREPMNAKACHGQIIHAGLQLDTLSSNILINTYSKCGLLGSARKMFDAMPARSLVSWNTIIGAYTHDGNDEVAINLFVQMHKGGCCFSEITVSTVLGACAANYRVFECKQLHGFVVTRAMAGNVFVGTALLDVYAKCGLIKEAGLLFERMSCRSEVTWSSMVAGYVQNELYEEGLKLFHRAHSSGLEYDQFMASSAISACAGLAALNEGNQVYAVVCKRGFDSNLFVASALIDMYARCGSIKSAYTTFVSLGEDNKTTVLWNAMITGFSKHARSTEAMILFEKMQQSGLSPNEVTYVSVLSSCSHQGLVEKGRRYFDMMVREHNVPHNVLHYACMIDILGRAGMLSEALDMIKRMPFEATASIWGSLLSACRNHKNVKFAELAAAKLFEIEPHNAGNHVLLSNVYASNKKWGEVAIARKHLKDSESKKETGKSWLEIKNNVHTFMVAESNHPQISEIYIKLEELIDEMKKWGYTPETEQDYHDVDELQKQQLLRHHSEKIALAFGLMQLPQGAPVTIMKNLRICGDCHSFMRYASSIANREIIVRDTNRFHHFENGACSCGDFW